MTHSTLTTSPATPSKSHVLPGGALLPPSELPVPNAEEVARFQHLFLARFGVQLSEEEAHDQAKRLVQFVFLMHHALPYLKDAQISKGAQINFNKVQTEHKNLTQMPDTQKINQKSLKPSL